MTSNEDVILNSLTTAISAYAAKAGFERVAGKLITATLIYNREIHGYATAQTKKEVDKTQLAGLDREFLSRLVSGLSGQGLKALGFFSEDSPLGQGLDLKALDPDVRSVIEEGRVLHMTGTLFFKKTDDAPSELPDTTGMPDIRIISMDMCRSLHQAIIRDDLGREDLLRYLNAVIYLEEALLCMNVKRPPEAKQLRKLSIDYTVMRFIGSIDGDMVSSIEELSKIFLQLGNTARMNNALSDGIDRVRTYCKDSAHDREKLETARAVRRPYPDRFQEISYGAQQSRLYRDGEIRPKRPATPTFRSRFGRQTPDGH